MVATGIVFLLWDFYSYAKQKLNESMGMIWGFVSIALIITGAVPALSGEVSEWLLICLFIISPKEEEAAQIRGSAVYFTSLIFPSRGTSFSSPLRATMQVEPFPSVSGVFPL